MSTWQQNSEHSKYSFFYIDKFPYILEMEAV